MDIVDYGLMRNQQMMDDFGTTYKMLKAPSIDEDSQVGKENYRLSETDVKRLQEHPVYIVNPDEVDWKQELNERIALEVDGYSLPHSGSVSYCGNVGSTALVANDTSVFGEIVYFCRVKRVPNYIQLKTHGLIYKVVIVSTEDPQSGILSGITDYYTIHPTTGQVFSSHNRRFELIPEFKDVWKSLVNHHRQIFIRTLTLYHSIAQRNLVQVGLADRTLMWDITDDMLDVFAKEVGQAKTSEEVRRLLIDKPVFRFGDGLYRVIAPPKTIDRLYPTLSTGADHLEDSLMNQTKFQNALKNQTSIAKKIIACLAPEIDYTMKEIYGAVRNGGHTTHNQRAIKAATLDLVEAGLMIRRGDKFSRADKIDEMPEPVAVVATAATKVAVTKDQHANKHSSVKTHSPKKEKHVLKHKDKSLPQVKKDPGKAEQALLPSDWIGSFVMGRKSSYDPSRKDFVTEHMYESGLYKHTLIMAAAVGDLIRYPINKIKNVREAYALFSSVMANHARKANMGMEYHVFKTYIDVLLVPIERMSMNGDFIEGRGRMEDILRQRISADEKLFDPTTNAKDWIFSITETSEVFYNPEVSIYRLAKGPVNGQQSYGDLKKVKPGEVIRFRRDPNLSIEQCTSRFLYALRHNTLKVGVYLEAHAFENYVDLFVTNVPIDHSKKLDLKVDMARPPFQHPRHQEQQRAVQLDQRRHNVDRDVGAVPTDLNAHPLSFAQEAPVVGAKVEDANKRVEPNDLLMWETTFTKLLDQGVDSDDAISRANRAVQAMQKLRS